VAPPGECGEPPSDGREVQSVHREVDEPGHRVVGGEPARDVVRVGALRVTTVQRTGADLARLLPRDEAVPMLRGLREVGFDPERALAQLVELRGQRGVRQARSILAHL
jgi:hypothetical protein